MFDIGFFELVTVFVVMLLVIGPEQLPSAARTAGLWIGRLKRSLNSIRKDIEDQLGADDVRRQLHNEVVLKELGTTPEALKSSIQEDIASITALHEPFSSEPQTPSKPSEPTSPPTTSPTTDSPS